MSEIVLGEGDDAMVLSVRCFRAPHSLSKTNLHQTIVWFDNGIQADLRWPLSIDKTGFAEEFK